MNKCSQKSTKSHQEVLKPESVIKAAATIEVTAVEGMTVGLHTTPRGATPILDADKVILDEDPIPGVLPTHVCPGDVLTGPNLHPDPVGGANPILTAEPDPD